MATVIGATIFTKTTMTHRSRRGEKSAESHTHEG